MKSGAGIIFGRCLLGFLIVILTVFSSGITVRQASADTAKCESCDAGGSIFGHSANSLRRHGLIRYTPEQIEAENRLLETAPLVKTEPVAGLKLLSDGYTEGATRNLLPLLSYDPTQRDQGYSCGSCWVWAGTGCLEVALNAQRSIKDRLSIQYFNSTYSGPWGWACCGGNASEFASHYNNTLKKAIPWSNTNAAYVDGSRTCYGSTAMPAGSISTTPNYPISSVTAYRIATYSTDGVTQATAIQNIKNVLDQNKAIYFGFTLANDADWDQFFDFWNYQPESYLWSYGYSHGDPYISGQTAGHAVLCVGYDDTPEGADNDYWVMLNSWGTTAGRPNGLFRVPMYYNYDSSISGYGYSTRWWTIEPTFTGGDTEQKLIGADDAASYGAATPGNMYLERWTASTSGTVSTIRVKGTANGAVKVAIYADSGGQPGALLGYQNASTPISSGWTTVTLAQTAAVTAGTAYWLATASGTPCIGFVYPVSAIGYWKPITYNTFTFSSNPSGLTSQSTWYIQAAGWGTGG